MKNVKNMTLYLQLSWLLHVTITVWNFVCKLSVSAHC